MRPRRYLERNRDCVRAGFAPGRPPPVHPRPTGACAAMRGFQICVSEPRANAKAALGMGRAPFPLHDVKQPAACCHAARLVPAARFCAGLVRPSRFLRPLHRISAALPALRRARPKSLRQLHSDPKRGAGGAPAGALLRLSRLRGATVRASEARRVPRKRDARLSALHRGVFGPGPRFRISGIICRIRQRGSSQPGHCLAGYGPGPFEPAVYEPRPQDATPRSAFWIVSGRRPSMSEDGNLCISSSLRSQYLNSFSSRKMGRRERLRANETRPRK